MLSARIDVMLGDAHLWVQLVQRKKTVDPSSAPRSCISLKRVAVLLQAGHVSDVVAHVSTSLWSSVRTSLRLARRAEGNASSLEKV